MTGTSLHWRIESDSDNIAWLTFDKAGSSTNTLSKDALEQLAQYLIMLRTSAPRGLVILSAKANGFIAGADVNEFTKIHDVSDATALLQRGKNVFDTIAALPFPTVAMISGHCLGGGLELALACRYRIAEDAPDTRLGLPEVMLGIYPGWGGVQRLPALIGAPAALDLLLTGRTIDARRAQRLGVIDFAVPRRQLKNAARNIIMTTPPRHRPTFLQRLSNTAPGRRLLAQFIQGKLAKKIRREQYPAPYAIIDLWENHHGNPLAVPPPSPSSIGSLLVGDTARNLVRVFFLQERLKALGRLSEFKAQHVHVIGAGVMGGDIAAWCALRGLRVTLQDQSAQRIGPAIKRANDLFREKLKQPRLIQAAMDRLTPDLTGFGIARADVVIEAIFEDLEAKQTLLKNIEPQLKAGALLTSNTSSIPLEKIAAALQNPARLVGLHFFNPVAKMKLIEIVSGAQTSVQTAHDAAAFARKIDRLPLPVKSAPGFLINRLLMPYMMEAMKMVSGGFSAEAVDAAAIHFGMPMGPIELADTVGLDICVSVGKMLNPSEPIPAVLEQLLDAGNLGKKSGRGFYEYRDGRPIKNTLRGGIPAGLESRLIEPLLSEAKACLAEGIVEDADLLDAGMIFATGFAPFRGGPMHYAETVR